MEYDLERFLFAQNKVWEQVIEELESGEKDSHWMWFVFPQIKGISTTFEGKYFSLEDIDEAREYYENPFLKKHMNEALRIILDSNTPLGEIFFYPDDLKFNSCMTLFKYATGHSVFKDVMEHFELKDCPLTMEILYEQA